MKINRSDHFHNVSDNQKVAHINGRYGIVKALITAVVGTMFATSGGIFILLTIAITLLQKDKKQYLSKKQTCKVFNLHMQTCKPSIQRWKNLLRICR